MNIKQLNEIHYLHQEYENLVAEYKRVNQIKVNEITLLILAINPQKDISWQSRPLRVNKLEAEKFKKYIQMFFDDIIQERKQELELLGVEL
jgi:hypothetical protein